VRCKAPSSSHSQLSFRSARIKYSGNKLKDLAAKKGIIIGGEDTCQGDSGGPVWVEENGKVDSVISHQTLNL